MNAIALLYDDDAYVERTTPVPGRPGPLGLMGRQVAGRAFLDALLAHGRWQRLVAVVRSRASARSLARFCHEHPSSRDRVRQLRLIEPHQFLSDFAADPPAPVLHVPCPPEASYAWARRYAGPHRFAISGVTHTLASADGVNLLAGLLTAPFEPYDALVCTSRAVVRMVRSVLGSYADFLRDRHGGAPALPVRLEQIPLGVDVERFRPATPPERAAARAQLGAADDEVVILFVGRLSYHAKAHPFPLYVASAAAARQTGRKVRLVLAGWTANAPIRAAFEDGARRFAPGVTVALVDGTDPDLRSGVWHAADLFASPSDSIQETFGLAVVEAMASGLPVVASDWDGYRDLVVDGETGLLVPTAMIAGSLDDVTVRLILGATGYDQFLAECGQAVSVDPAAFGQALTRLVADAELRRAFGEAGRRRAVERFAWRTIIPAYETLWAEQAAECAARRVRAGEPAPAAGLPLYPEPLASFEGYPTRRLDADTPLIAAAGVSLDDLLACGLTNYVGERRVTDPELLRTLLAAAAAPRRVQDLDEIMARAGIARRAGRATLAWLLKYGLLRCNPQEGPPWAGPS